jgi:hypothetical protein
LIRPPFDLFIIPPARDSKETALPKERKEKEAGKTVFFPIKPVVPS